MTGQAQTENHWWFRPGWDIGRRFLTWHLTFDGQDGLHAKAALYRAALADLSRLDLVPDPWLHLTMQGLGFVGEVDEDAVRAIVEAAPKHLAAVPAFDLTLDRPSFTPEAMRWDPVPAAPVAAVRDAIRAGIGEVLPAVPEAAAGFTPHVTIAYANAVAPAAPILEALAAVPSDPIRVRISSAALIELGRDRRMYEWTTVAEVPLGT